MRYCNKTKEIIHSSYKTLSAEDIQEIIADNNLTYRSVKRLKAYIKELYKRDELREAKRLKYQEWALKDPIKYRASTLLSGAKQRAKTKGIPFDLTKEWIEEKLKAGKCEVTEISFVIKEYAKKNEHDCVHPHAPSLDQIEPSKGYTKDNVQVVVDQYNKMKNDRDLETTVFLARKLVEAYDRRKIDLLVE